MTLSTYYNYSHYPFQTPNNNNFDEFINLHDELAPQKIYNDFPSYLDESFNSFPTSIPNVNINYPDIYPSQLFDGDEIFPIEDNYDYNYLACPKKQKICYQEDEPLHSSMFQDEHSSMFQDEHSSMFQDVMPSSYLLDEFVSNPITSSFPLEPFCDLPCPKKQKISYQEEEPLHSSMFQDEHSSLFQDVMMPSSYLLDEFVSNPIIPSFTLEPFCVGQEFNVTPNTSFDDVKCEKHLSEKTISTQSIAARERRRKITEKTQELGKLVPGGPKMNTAEMLNAAAKYVKFLQAQVGILQLMEETPIEDESSAPPTNDLHKLVVSPYVQEKLYSEEKCFVPKEFVTSLTNNDDVQSNSTIMKGLEQLIGTGIEKKPKQDKF